VITINNKILRGKKAQAAMEFLTTYGWAILILIIVIVALANLGVFRSPSTPNTCSVSAPFACSDIIIDNSSTTASTTVSVRSNITLKANNVASASIAGFRVNSGQCTQGAGNALFSGTFQGNGDNVITLTCNDGSVGNKEIGEVDVTYTLLGGGSAHTTTIKYSATRE